MMDFSAAVWAKLKRAISCGYCGTTTTVGSKYSCSKCGRVLCPSCGERWSFCKDHIPVCNHLSLIPTTWNQSGPESTKMIGSCQHNMTCLICGFGWGCAPDPCDELEDVILVTSGILPRLVTEVLQEPPSLDWEQELEEM